MTSKHISLCFGIDLLTEKIDLQDLHLEMQNQQFFIFRLDVLLPKHFQQLWEAFVKSFGKFMLSTQDKKTQYAYCFQ